MYHRSAPQREIGYVEGPVRYVGTKYVSLCSSESGCLLYLFLSEHQVAHDLYLLRDGREKVCEASASEAVNRQMFTCSAIY